MDSRAFLLLGLGGCATFSAARPLEAGNTLIGATAGGPLFDFGGTVLPVPSAVVEVRHGLAPLLDRPIDVGGGLNLTALPFGLTQGHLGASWLLVEQVGARPAITVTDRLFFGVNLPGPPGRPDPRVQLWGADQIELSASWQVPHAVPYASLSQYIDFGDPSWLLTPAAGVQIDPQDPGGLLLQAELRWFGITRATPSRVPDWIPAGDLGALGISVSGGLRLGRSP